MKSMIPLLALLQIWGCSHVSKKEVAVEFPFAVDLVERMQKASYRAPASLALDEVEGKSPRRVYFTTLYHQYLTLSQHLQVPGDVSSCPQFHHDKLETDEVRVPQVSLVKSDTLDPQGKEYFPETAFSRQFSLKDHHQNIRNEIAVLCEEGVSDNYYKFDNLVTNYAGNRNFHGRPDAMKSVLKIPVFANYYLLKMLQPSHSLAFAHPEEKKIIVLTHTHWFERYVSEAHRVRSNFLKNQMVKR